jgi:hypothetical protein
MFYNSLYVTQTTIKIKAELALFGRSYFEQFEKAKVVI